MEGSEAGGIYVHVGLTQIADCVEKKQELMCLLPLVGDHVSRSRDNELYFGR